MHEQPDTPWRPWYHWRSRLDQHWSLWRDSTRAQRSGAITQSEFDRQERENQTMLFGKPLLSRCCGDPADCDRPCGTA